MEEKQVTIASTQEYTKKQDVKAQELTKKITMMGRAEKAHRATTA